MSDAELTNKSLHRERKCKTYEQNHEYDFDLLSKIEINLILSETWSILGHSELLIFPGILDPSINGVHHFERDLRLVKLEESKYRNELGTF